MAEMNIPNLAGTLILLLSLIAMYPVYTEALNIFLPQAGSFETLLAKLIPVSLLLGILANVWPGSGDDGRR